MQKGFAPIFIILSIVLLAAVVGGAYYFGQSSVKLPATSPQVSVSTSQISVSPTQPPVETSVIPTPTSAAPIVDETATWKIYRNTKYGYELKYPESVTVEANSAKSSGLATGNDEGIVISDLLDITPINALGNCSDLRSDQAIISCLDSAAWAQQDKWVPVMISGKPGVRRETTLKPVPAAGSDIAPVGYMYYVNNGQVGLQIGFGDSISRRTLMEQILSTFKFTQ